MSFVRLVEQTRADRHLLVALLELTYRCNLDCFFCYNDVSLTGRPLSLPQYEALLSDLAGMQTLYVNLTGGEPLAHPDFFAIGRKARELGFVVQVKSNGHALRGPVARRVLEEVDPFVVEVSLHGARAETHDRQTRVAGSFDRLIANVEEARGIGLRLKLNTTMTTWNEGEVEEMFALADRLGVRLQVDIEVTPRDDGDRTPLALTPTDEGVRRLFRIRRERAQAAAARARPEDEVAPRGPDDDLVPVPGGSHCGAGTASVTVDPYGNVYPCVQWRVPVGSLHDRSIREIWTGSAELDRVRAENAAVRDRLQERGEESSLLSFCPGSAAQVGGSPLASYPAAERRLRFRQEAEGRLPLPTLPALP